MSFTELNTVEHYIIHQLSGVNLNEKGICLFAKKIRSLFMLLIFKMFLCAQ